MQGHTCRFEIAGQRAIQSQNTGEQRPCLVLPFNQKATSTIMFFTSNSDTCNMERKGWHRDLDVLLRARRAKSCGEEPSFSLNPLLFRQAGVKLHFDGHAMRPITCEDKDYVINRKKEGVEDACSGTGQVHAERQRD